MSDKEYKEYLDRINGITCCVEKKEESRWISVEEVAELLEVNQGTVYRWLKKGVLPGKRLGAKYFLERTKVMEMLQC